MKMKNKVPPRFILDILNEVPTAGDGVHPWLFRVARYLHAYYFPDDIVGLLESRVASCGRPVPRSEIENAVRDSMACAWQPGSGAASVTKARKWPSVNLEQREAIVNDGDGLAGLWEASPVFLGDNVGHTDEIIDQLFPGDPLLCVGKSSSVFQTKPRSEWRGKMSGLQLIVPSPMSALVGKKKNPKRGENPLSAHTLDNTGPRRFLVCEFDSGTTDEHAALLLHLGTFAPLVCVVHSGGKSLHGWFFVSGQPDEKVEKFFRYAVSLGADQATWTRSQFVRMPDGTRDNGKRQVVYFLNFNPLNTTI